MRLPTVPVAGETLPRSVDFSAFAATQDKSSKLLSFFTASSEAIAKATTTSILCDCCPSRSASRAATRSPPRERSQGECQHQDRRSGCSPWSTHRDSEASVRLGTDCGNSSMRTPRRDRRCAVACIWYGSNKTRRTLNRRCRSSSVASIAASKSSGSDGEDWKIRCQTSRTRCSLRSQCTATIAVLSRFTEASTDTHSEQAVGKHRRGTGVNARVPPRQIDERTLAGNEAILDHAQVRVGPNCCRICASQRSSCHGATGVCDQNIGRPCQHKDQCQRKAPATHADIVLRATSTRERNLVGHCQPTRDAPSRWRHQLVRKRRERSDVYADSSSKHAMSGWSPLRMRNHCRCVDHCMERDEGNSIRRDARVASQQRRALDDAPAHSNTGPRAAQDHSQRASLQHTSRQTTAASPAHATPRTSSSRTSLAPKKLVPGTAAFRFHQCEMRVREIAFLRSNLKRCFVSGHASIVQ